MSKPDLLLIGVCGPLEGRSFPLGEDGLSIGRDPSNEIELPDLLVSRNHCALSLDERGLVRISDLGSSNGTYVNGSRLQSGVLSSGDRLEIGQSTFVLSAGVTDVLVRLEDSPGQETIRATGAFVPVIRDAAARDWTGRERSLHALLSMGTALSRWKNLAELEDLILREVLAATAAERAALVYLEADSGEILQTRRRPQQPEARPMLVSRGIIKEALASGNAILHARDPKARVESESFLQSGAVAVLAAPLIVRGDVQALLYLESGPEHTFPDFDLELVSAIAGMSATPLETARRLEQLEQEKRAIEQGGGSAFQMIGESLAMQNVYRVIRRAAPSDTTVLILGESGTGKEMAARAIHSGSPRHRGPWVAINCACLGENLLESELFGHERGAFTGAFSTKPGKLEVANGGTLFLDEIGELPLSVQAKLLRVLQEREFERLGSTKVRRTDIRLIAATNQDLQQRIAEGRFRSDLFYRLNVVSLRVPPLRERAEDILLVASYFISRMQLKANRRVEGISSSARRALLHWNWPGNVRELQNVIERAIILGADCEIRLEDLPEELIGTAAEQPTPTGYHAAVLAAKKEILREALASAGGSVVGAAKALGINAKYLHRLLRNIDPKTDDLLPG